MSTQYLFVMMILLMVFAGCSKAKEKPAAPPFSPGISNSEVKTENEDANEVKQKKNATLLEKHKNDKATGTVDLINITWMEKRVNQVGIDLLLKEYEGHTDKTVQVIKAALGLSTHILRNHPEALRSQLQARLVGRTEPELQLFQVLPKKAVQIRSEWKTFNQPGGTLSRVLSGSYVYDVAMTPDGKHAIIAPGDGTVELWDLETGNEARIIQAHSSGFDSHVSCVAISTDGKQAISGSEDKTLKVWDLATGKEVYTLEGHGKKIKCISITPDGKFAVSGSDDTMLKVWDLASGKEVHTLGGHLGEVNCVTITQDGQRAVSSADDGNIIIWDIKTGKELKILDGYDKYKRVNCLAITPNGKRAAASIYSKTIDIWNLETGKKERTFIGRSQEGTLNRVGGVRTPSFTGHIQDVTCLEITDDGKHVISGAYDNTIKIWDIDTGKEEQTLKGHFKRITCLAVSADGKKLLSGSSDGTLREWDLEIKDNFTPPGHVADVNKISISADGQRAATVSSDITLKVWDLKTEKILQTYPLGHIGRGTMVGLSADGQRAISYADFDGIKVWNLKNKKMERSIKSFRSFEYLLITPDGKLAVFAAEQGSIKVWELETNKEVRSLKGHSKNVRVIALSKDGKRLVSGADDNKAIVWNLETGKVEKTLSGKFPFFGKHIAISSNGKHAVFLNDNDVFKVYHLETGAEEFNVPRGHVLVRSLIISSDGTYVIASVSYGALGRIRSGYGAIRIWETKTGKQLIDYQLDDVALDIAISSDDKTLFIAGQSGRVHKLELQIPSPR